MWFDPAVVETVRDAFPAWMAFLFAFLSHLGSVWFVAPVVVVAYWFGDRYRFAPWLGIVIGGYALMIAAKGYFAIERPDVGPAVDPGTLPVPVQAVYAPAVEITTSSFPSGHALAGTVVWTMLALETDYGTRRARWAVAAFVVALVSLSRVAVGVHYPIDVVVGVAIAVAYLVVVLGVRERAAERGPHAAAAAVFATAVVVSALAVLVTGSGDAAALLGGSIGAFVAWRYATPSPEPWPPTPRTIGGALVGCVALVGVALASLVVEWVVVWLCVGLVAGAVVVAVPRLVVVDGSRTITAPSK